MELFDQLRRSQVTVSTQDLTTALNWASVAQQQDAHEFMRVLFERIENELKKHGQHKRLIEDLFQGEKSDYVHCLKCRNVTNTDAVFREFQLDIPSDGPARIVRAARRSISWAEKGGYVEALSLTNPLR
jgi:ubiquitin C-terminal hydrolase